MHLLVMLLKYFELINKRDVVSVVWCQVEFSATSWSLVQRGSTDCDASFCVIYKLRKWGGPDPMGAVAPKKKQQDGERNIQEIQQKLVKILD